MQPSKINLWSFLQNLKKAIYSELESLEGKKRQEKIQSTPNPKKGHNCT